MYKQVGVGMALAVVILGCTSDAERLEGIWRIEPSCTTMPEMTGAAGGGGALGAAIVTAVVANARFTYAQGGRYEAFLAGRDTAGTWAVADGNLTTTAADGQTQTIPLSFEDGRALLVRNTGVLCLRPETEQEAAAVAAAIAQAAAQAAAQAEAAERLRIETEAARSMVNVQLVSVTYTPADYGRGVISDSLSFTVTMTNTGSQAVNAIRGAIVYVNAFDEAAAQLTIARETPIPPGQTISDTFTLDYNQFMEAHQTLRAFQPGQTNTRWDPSDLVLADGTRINIAAAQ